MHPDFTMSLCICTRNRPDDLHRCLEAVSQSTTMPFQIIVSDDSDHPEKTLEVVRAFPFASYQRGPKKGLGANRNACLDRVTGRHVMFIDDDVLLPADFVSSASAICETYSRKVPLPIITGIEFKHIGDQAMRVEPSNPDFWGFQKISPKGFYSAIVINATIFPSDLFSNVRFDNLLKYGSEERDVACHAVARGFEIIFEPSLFVHHYPSTINRDEYASLVDASRLYATAKAYWCYQRNPLKTLTYVLLAPPKELFAKTRRFGIPGIKSAILSTATACRYAISAIRRDAQIPSA
jgi:glycosyltransferase involved in cell wall biosynthesis